MLPNWLETGKFRAIQAQANLKQAPTNLQYIENVQINQQAATQQPPAPTQSMPDNAAQSAGPNPVRMSLDEQAPKQADLPDAKIRHPLQFFKGQELELHYIQHKLKPEVEKEIKKALFEIRKKFQNDAGEQVGAEDEEEVQVYISHISLQTFHPIFSKLAIETVKLVLQYSNIIFLNKDQTLFTPGFNDSFFYIVLYGKLRVYRPNVEASSTKQLEPVGQIINIGWTIGEEILFKTAEGLKPARRDSCKAKTECCVLAMERRGLSTIKKQLSERTALDEFQKLETVLRGNYFMK